ncbi:MAG: GNAT family N-acetyltransferase [Candidatus Puniceispirillales bacterium WSBS_2018_MAG_OTU23]
MTSVRIIPIAQAHFDEWRVLYHGYADHYQVGLTADGIAATWGWLMDAGHPLQGFVAIDGGGGLVGLAHYRAMPSPLRGVEVGFLDDLFVAPASRGGNIGGTLLDRLNDIGKANGWPVIRWITRDNNYPARRLYDQKAVKADWNTYEMKPFD